METVFNYIEPFEKFLTILNRHGISIADVKYFNAYREFLQLRGEGHTYYASLETVSEHCGIPVGTLRTKFKTFSGRLGI